MKKNKDGIKLFRQIRIPYKHPLARDFENAIASITAKQANIPCMTRITLAFIVI